MNTSPEPVCLTGAKILKTKQIMPTTRNFVCHNCAISFKKYNKHKKPRGIASWFL